MGFLGNMTISAAAALLVLAALEIAACSTESSQVPCFFIFGDSLVDNGNNNGILTLARANYLPYGVDFPDGASGRFTNGRTTVDILGSPTLTYFPDEYVVSKADFLRSCS